MDRFPDPPIDLLAAALEATNPTRRWRAAAVPAGALTWHVESDSRGGWYVELVEAPPTGRLRFLCAMRIVDGLVTERRWLHDGPTHPDL